jgi:hypothetical protein
MPWNRPHEVANHRMILPTSKFVAKYENDRPLSCGRTDAAT